jgi:hypothetical protein
VNALPALRIVFVRCLRQAAVPWLLAAALAAVAAAATQGFGDDAPAARAPWLHLPAFVGACACGWTALESWPAFARQQPGADWVLRLRSDPWYGCGNALLGALAAFALLLLPIGLAAAALAPAPRVHRALQATGTPLLDAEHDTVTFAVDGGPFAGLQLRPFAFLPPAAPEPAALAVSADGAPLVAAPVPVAGTRELLEIAFAPRAIRALTVRRTAGNLPLLFVGDAAVLIEAAPRSRLGNGLFAAGCWLLPLAVALALATLAAPAVALPVNGMLLVAALLLQTLGRLGPAADALAAALRGRWLPTDPVFRGCLPSLGTGVLAMIAAMPLRRRLRR